MSKQNQPASLAVEEGLRQAGMELLYLSGYVAGARDVGDCEPASVRVARGREALAVGGQALDRLDELMRGARSNRPEGER